MDTREVQDLTDDEFETYLKDKFGADCYGLRIFHAELARLAADIHATDLRSKNEQTAFLREARRLYKALGYGSLKGLHLRLARGGDADSLPGLDDVAERMAFTHPEYFAGCEDTERRLFELLSAGNPKPMTKDEATTKAIEYLEESETMKARLKLRPITGTTTATAEVAPVPEPNAEAPAEVPAPTPAPKPKPITGTAVLQAMGESLTPYIIRWQNGERIGVIARELGHAFQSVDCYFKETLKLSRN